MVFNSLSFLVFFPVVTILFFLLPHKYRWALLISASLFFYMYFKPVYILIIFFTIVVDYFAGILIHRSQGAKRRMFLVMSLIANIGVLAIFKYYNFIDLNIEAISQWLHFTNPMPALDIILPIGLSFHTFQAMSYTIEVYKGNYAPERRFHIYALYVIFYPQMVSGPIERPQNLIHQFDEKKSFDPYRVGQGLQLMLWGLFKKVVIADRIAIYVDTVYSNVQLYTGFTFWFAAAMFLVQVYCDFSGYSDIAIGAAQVMGFNLMQNFKRPLFARSITEFWRRWHISLSTWLRDYLYTPLSVAWRYWGILGIALALLITLSISGLWHGAGWTFVIYGFIHGSVMCYELFTTKFRKKLSKKIPAVIYNNVSMVLTFSFVAVSLIFFRSHTFEDALYVIRHLFFFEKQMPPFFGTMDNFIYLFTGIVLLFLVEYRQEFITKKEELWKPRTAVTGYIFYAAFITLVLLTGVFNGGQFLYFQF